MTNEERQKLCEQMRRHDPWPCWPRVFEKAADEIERLAAELKQVEAEDEHHIRLAFIDAGANPARTWKEEAERLTFENGQLTQALIDELAKPKGKENGK